MDMDMDMDNNIRKPDPVKKERLIDNIWTEEPFYSLHEYSYMPTTQENHSSSSILTSAQATEDIKNSQWTEVLQKSMEEYEAMEKIEIETVFLESFLIEKSNRLQKVEPILQKLKRIMGYDSVIKQIYEIIQPLLDSYCNQYCIHSELDSDTYHFVFKHIRNIRMTSEEFNFLESFFICA